MQDTFYHIGMFTLMWLFFFGAPMPFGLGYELLTSEKKEAITALKLWGAITFVLTAILYISIHSFA